MATALLPAAPGSFRSTGAVEVSRGPRWLPGGDLGLLYAMVVLAVFGVARLLSLRERAAFVLAASTNLDNLASSPLRVLLASAFVVPTAVGHLVALSTGLLIAFWALHSARRSS